LQGLQELQGLQAQVQLLQYLPVVPFRVDVEYVDLAYPVPVQQSNRLVSG